MHEGGSLVPRPSHTAAKNSCEGRPGYEAGGGRGQNVGLVCMRGVASYPGLPTQLQKIAVREGLGTRLGGGGGGGGGRPGYEAGGGGGGGGGRPGYEAGGGRGQNVGLVCMKGVASYPGLPTQLQKIAVREGLGTRLGGGRGQNVGLVCMRGVASYPGLPTQLQKIAVREGLGTRLGGGGGGGRGGRGRM